MYGLSKDSSARLSFLIGKEICQIAIGMFDVQFNWGNGGISVWSRFMFKAAGTAAEVVWVEGNPESATVTVRLLKTRITSVDCSKGTLNLGFANGDRLEIFEDERYESFGIRDGKNPQLLV